ncbi:MAG: TatD family hydrolase [Anaerovoracaceae bacterium]|jgi:TatD DNase family protein
MLIDAHTHIRKEDIDNGILRIMEDADIYSLVAATNPEEAEYIKKLAASSPRIIPTYGLHPWYSHKHSLLDMRSYFEESPIIGEIGMDSTWCHVDLDCQRKIFIKQLEIAEERGCPVMLHTKGQEREILGIINEFSMPVIVHWYSSMDYLEGFLIRGCYFTVGPDVRINPAVQQVVEKAPLERLLVETDGLGAVEWALGKKVLPKDLPNILQDSLDCIAEIKDIHRNQVQKEMEATFKRLIFK